MTLPWLFLFLAGLAEVVWAVFLKQTAGFSRLWPSVITIMGMVASFVLLSQALKTLPVGTAYAVWTGIGAVGTAIVGIVALGEPREAIRVVSIGLIVTGIVGLKLASPA
jgi:quaternary ammonium compound-resistance protein SugE